MSFLSHFYTISKGFGIALVFPLDVTLRCDRYYIEQISPIMFWLDYKLLEERERLLIFTSPKVMPSF
jgi:hypothetical protein